MLVCSLHTVGCPHAPAQPIAHLLRAEAVLGQQQQFQPLCGEGER